MSHAVKHMIFSALVLSSAAALGCGPADSPAAYLVENEPTINGIAVDDFNIYFIRKDGHLKKASLDGGKPVELVSGIHDPVAIALDHDNVYWVTAKGAVGSVPKKGGDSGKLVDEDPTQVAMAALAIGNDVYFGTKSAGVMSVPIKGGAPTALLGGGVTSTGGTFGYDGGGFIYAMNGQGELMRVATDGSGTKVMADQQDGTTSIAADASFVYWVSPNPPGADKSSGLPQGKVFRMRPDGNDLVTVAVEQDGPFRVAGDEKNVYWTNDIGTISMASVDGTAEPFVMSYANPDAEDSAVCQDGETPGHCMEVYLALDAANVYWARSDFGTVTVTPKPQDIAP